MILTEVTTLRSFQAGRSLGARNISALLGHSFTLVLYEDSIDDYGRDPEYRSVFFIGGHGSPSFRLLSNSNGVNCVSSRNLYPWWEKLAGSPITRAEQIALIRAQTGNENHCWTFLSLATAHHEEIFEWYGSAEDSPAPEIELVEVTLA